MPNKPKLPRDVLELVPPILPLLNPDTNGVSHRVILMVKTLNYADNLALRVLLMQRRSRRDNRRRQFRRHGATAAVLNASGPIKVKNDPKTRSDRYCPYTSLMINLCDSESY